jgi:hypothetical protein
VLSSAKIKAGLVGLENGPINLWHFFTDESPNIIHAGDVVNKPFYFLKYTTFASKKETMNNLYVYHLYYFSVSSENQTYQ